MRETLFNWLGQSLYGKRCLDLFAGSGALGFEAASRGADQVVLVERNRAVYRALQETMKSLGFSNVSLRLQDGLECVRQDTAKYDVIFLDPPFQAGLLPKLLPLLPQRLLPDGLVYVESGEAFAPDSGWQVVRQGKAGQVHYQLLRYEAEQA